MNIARYQQWATEHSLRGYVRYENFRELTEGRGWNCNLQEPALTVPGLGSFPIDLLGTYNPDGTFLWSWANPGAAGFSPKALEFANQLRERGRNEDGLELFQVEKVKADWEACLEIALVCSEIAGGYPLYVGVNGPNRVLMLVRTQQPAQITSIVTLPRILLDFQQITSGDPRASIENYLEKEGFKLTTHKHSTRAGDVAGNALELTWNSNREVESVQMEAQGKSKIGTPELAGCSFCGAARFSGSPMIASGKGVICHDCVQLCVDIVEEGNAQNGFPEAERLYREGLEHYKRSEYDEASKKLELARVDLTDSFEIHLCLGEIYRQMEPVEFDKARARLLKAQALKPQEPGPWRELGRLLKEGEQWEEALKMLNVALALGGNHWDLYRQAECLQALNRLPEALETLQRLTGSHPDFGWAWSDLGQVLLNSGRPVEAVDALKRAVHLESRELWVEQLELAEKAAAAA